MSKDKKLIIKLIIIMLSIIGGIFLLLFFLKEALIILQDYLYAKPNNASTLWLESSATSCMLGITTLPIILGILIFGRKDKKKNIKNKKLGKISRITSIVVIIFSLITIYVMAIRNFAYCTDNKIVYRGFFDVKETSYDLDKIDRMYTKTRKSRKSGKSINLVVQFSNKNKVTLNLSPHTNKGVKQILENTSLDIEFDTSYAKEQFLKRFK